MFLYNKYKDAKQNAKLAKEYENRERMQARRNRKFNVGALLAGMGFVIGTLCTQFPYGICCLLVGVLMFMLAMFGHERIIRTQHRIMGSLICHLNKNTLQDEALMIAAISTVGSFIFLGLFPWWLGKPLVIVLCAGMGFAMSDAISFEED